MKEIYRASFVLGNPDSLSLEKIIRAFKRWSDPKVNVRNFTDYEKGADVVTPTARLQTIRLPFQEKLYFGLLLEEQDNNNHDLLWRSSAALVSDGFDKHVEISLGNGRMDQIVTPNFLIPSRPKIVADLINLFSGRDGSYWLSSKPKEVCVDDAFGFAKMINDRERKLPIVYVSRNSAGELPTDINSLAWQLAGIAHTYYPEPDRKVSFEFERCIGKSLCCYNGAVRIYWPMPEKNSSVSHQLWLADHIKLIPRFDRELLRMISSYSVSRESIINFQMIMSLSEQKDAEELEKAHMEKVSELKRIEDFPKLTELYAEENEALRKKLSDALDEIKQLRKESFGMQAKVEELVAAVNVYKGSEKGARTSQDEINGLGKLKDVNSAVIKFAILYPNSDVILHPRAIRSAKSCHYENPLQVFRALEWLSTEYIQYRREGGLTDQMLPFGMTYCAKQNDVTMGRYPDDYFIRWQGRKIPLEEHLKKGRSKNPRETIRIGFLYDPDLVKVIVGYIGHHQTNRNT